MSVVPDALIWELMLQAGPVVNVHLPKDRISMAHQGFGFCEFLTEEDAEYAFSPFDAGSSLKPRPPQLSRFADVMIYTENVDERLLYDTFSAFGMMATTAKIARDPQTGQSKGYGFVSYTDFESADAAIESMNGQFLMNKPITVQYAFKKDGKGERHGTAAERLLAAQARKNNALPLAPRPPPVAYGAAPPLQGFTGPYQGQFAGALAAPPPPPPGFTPMPMQASGARRGTYAPNGYGYARRNAAPSATWWSAHVQPRVMGTHHLPRLALPLWQAHP
ncbi:hypothetical protein EDB89DRAFT_2061943 [Lactarius sanguifluus]|nr:hypothetical protein EDB89DRAFT_2061943 [Lactarius sanguifluus]